MRSAAAEVLVAGVKVATQTPPIRSGKRVVFVTLDDAQRPGRRDVLRGRPGSLRRDAVPLVAAGDPRRRPAHRAARGVAAGHRLLGAAGLLADGWSTGGVDAALAEIDRVPETVAEVDPGPAAQRVLVHPSGFRQSPYADIKPPGESTGQVTGEVARKLWHSSPGSSG